MFIYRCEAENKRTILFDRIAVADNFFSKLTGLIFKKSLGDGQGLLIRNCNSIHTFWMRFKIDVIFLGISDDESPGFCRVVDLIENIKPFTFSRIVPDSFYVLELRNGAIALNNIKKNDLLFIKLSH